MRIGLGLGLGLGGGPSSSGPAPAPTISSLSASLGSETGGTAITITGTGFLASPAVTFGGVTATSIVLVSSTAITCVTPSGAPTGSTASVVVTNTDTQSASTTFQYVPGPDLTSTRRVWYRGDVLTQAASLITAVPDLSGSGDANKNLSAAGANRPGYTAANASYNNKPSINFGAGTTKKLVSGIFAAPIAQQFTAYIVGQSAHAGSPFFFCASSDTAYVFDSAALGTTMNAGGGNLSGDYSAGARITWCRFNGASSSHGDNKIAATVSGAVGAGGIAAMAVGNQWTLATTPLEGEICEFIILDGHNLTDKAAMLAYLQARYAITMTP